jgi:hypothetical protein
MSNFKFATNKTFNIVGHTTDTMEPYFATIGFQLELCADAVGGGKHYAVKMMTVAQVYDDVVIDRTKQRAAKADAQTEANHRCDLMNGFLGA